MSAGAANTWLAVSLLEVEQVAAQNGTTITGLDAQCDPVLRQGFDAMIADHPHIQGVAEGEGKNGAPPVAALP